MKRIEQYLDGLIVVDPNLEDYEPLINELHLDELSIRMFSTGEDALRASTESATVLWIVNIRLPDISGVTFLQLLRRRIRRSTVFLVGNCYSAVDELAVRSAGATAYVCKPASAAWLEGYRRLARSPAIHSPVNAPGVEAAMRPP